MKMAIARPRRTSLLHVVDKDYLTHPESSSQGLESKTPLTNKHSISAVNEAIKASWKYNVVVRQANTDRGSEFYSNKKGRNPGSKSDFERFLFSVGVKHVPSRVGNPQTNGKLERHWREYDRHRWRFNSLKEYVEW